MMGIMGKIRDIIKELDKIESSEWVQGRMY